MAIRMTYSCSCGFRSLSLQDTQQHADETGHAVSIHGTLTAREISVPKLLEKSAEQKARELAILREAKNRGLVK